MKYAKNKTSNPPILSAETLQKLPEKIREIANELHCFKWLKFHFCELENSRLFDEFLVPMGWIIFLGL